MNQRHVLRFLPLLLIFLVLAGCKKAPSAPGTIPTTPYQQALLYNTGLAQSNEDIAQVVQALNTQGTIKTADARTILTVQFKIAAADKKLSAILAQGQPVALSRSAEINAILSEISDATTSMISSGLVGVTDPARQKQIATDIGTVTGLAKLMIVALQAAGVLTAQNNGGLPWAVQS